jgi:two-component system, NarL family, nitrate/nitrite response regulator NarL
MGDFMSYSVSSGNLNLPKLFISDRNSLGCQSLARALQRHYDPVDSVTIATTSEQILQAIRDKPPDVALISAALADGPLAGFKILPILQSVCPSCAVVVLLDENDHDLVLDAFRAHARGVFIRAQPIGDLIKCVRVVYEGQVWIDTRHLRLVLDAFSDCAPFHTPNASGLVLTKRELEIASLVAAAQSNRQISRRLNLSEHTVKNYLFRIYEKIGVASRVELAVYIMNLPQNSEFHPMAPSPKVS